MNNKKLRIVHVTSMHDWKDDRIFERACMGLSNSGHDVFLVASPRLNHYKSDIHPKPNEKHTSVNGVNIYWITDRQGWKRRILGSWEAARIAASLKPDFIHFHDPDLIPSMLLRQWSGNKVIYDIHENYISRILKLPVNKYLKTWLAKLFRSFENWCANQFSGVVVVTKSLGKLFNTKPDRLLVIGNLPYLKILAQLAIEKKKESRPTIYTSGTISNERNCLQTVQALPYIIPFAKDTQIVFAGKYSNGLDKLLNETASKIGHAENLRTEGMLPYLENFKRTSRAHIGCVFYQDNHNNQIGLPNRIFEYMYCGVAVIGEDFPEVKSIINDAQCGQVVDSSKPEEIGRVLISMLQKPEQLKIMGEAGRKAVLEKYNFEVALKELESFYHHLLTKKD